jgi:hypothetical protein
MLERYERFLAFNDDDFSYNLINLITEYMLQGYKVLQSLP